MKAPKLKKGYKKGGTVSDPPPDWSKISSVHDYPPGYFNFPNLGSVLLPGVTSANGMPVYYDPKKVSIDNTTPTQPVPATNTVAAPVENAVPAVPVVPVPVVKKAPMSNDDFLKELEKWKGGSAQKVPAELANHIEKVQRAYIQKYQPMLDAAAAKKYGSSGGPVKGQQLSRAEAEKVIGKDNYDQFLQHLSGYEAYRAQTKGTYDTQNVSWGATDKKAEMYGMRMSNMFKNTEAQSEANVKKTPQAVLDWQKNPDIKKLNAESAKKALLNSNPVLLDNNNQPIPAMQYDKDGKPIIEKAAIYGFKDGGPIPKKSKRKGYAEGSVVEPDLTTLTPEQLAQYNALVNPADKQALLASLKDPTVTAGAGAGATDFQKGAAMFAPAVGDIASKQIDKADVNMDGQHGKRNAMFKDGASLAVKRAGQGVAVGANPLLVAATGGLSIPIAAAAFAIEGATEGAIKGKKKYNAYTGEMQSQGAASAAQGQYNLKDGGKVVGAGTGKSDSIPAKIEPGSFIVPKENAKAAEAIRKAYLGKKSGYAPLKDAGGVNVNLSNGEHKFSAHEHSFLLSKGVDMKALAPNAKPGVSGLQEGGPVTDPPMTPEEKAAFDKLYAGTKKVATSKEADPTIAALVKQYQEAETLEDVTRIRAQLKELGYKTDGTPWNAPAAKTEASAEVADDAQADDVQDDPESTKRPPSKAEKIFNGLGGYGGLGALVQTTVGLIQTVGKKPPVDKVDPQLLSQQQEALTDAKTGFTPSQTAVAKNGIEMNRRSNVYNVNNMSGGDAGLAIANSRSANLGANQSILELVARDEQVKQMKKNRADMLTEKVANSKRQIFEDERNMFMANNEAGGKMALSGINNFFGNLRYQDYMKQKDKRAADSEITFNIPG